MFTKTGKRLVTILAAGAAVAGAGSLAFQPAAAENLISTVAGIVTCSATTACAGWQNTGTGPALSGSAAKNDGIRGFTTAATKSGVYGESDASGGGWGVHGSNASSKGIGVYATGGSGVGALLTSGSNSANGIPKILSEGGNPGAVIGGPVFGAIITSGENGTPLLIQGTSSSGGGEVTIDSTGNINTTGNIIYAGSLINGARTQSGARVSAFTASATQATVEDSGTAQLVGGSATVRLDPLYAQSIDMRTPYRVFLTPDADSHGLYIALKTSTAFVVREMQGGRGTYSFDYRILGTALGQTGQRMAALPAAEQAFLNRSAP